MADKKNEERPSVLDNPFYLMGFAGIFVLNGLFFYFKLPGLLNEIFIQNWAFAGAGVFVGVLFVLRHKSQSLKRNIFIDLFGEPRRFQGALNDVLIAIVVTSIYTGIGRSKYYALAGKAVLNNALVTSFSGTTYDTIPVFMSGTKFGEIVSLTDKVYPSIMSAYSSLAFDIFQTGFTEELLMGILTLIFVYSWGLDYWKDGWKLILRGETWLTFLITGLFFALVVHNVVWDASLPYIIAGVSARVVFGSLFITRGFIAAWVAHGWYNYQFELIENAGRVPMTLISDTLFVVGAILIINLFIGALLDLNTERKRRFSV